MMRYTIPLMAASMIAALPAQAEVPVVVTDVQPVQALVAQVMGDLGEPLLLLERGANEHDVQLRPSQLRALADAGLVVWVGPELTPWLDRALENTSGAERLGLLAVPGTVLRDFAPEAEGAAEEHDHEEHADDHDEHGDEEHEHHHHGTDPHAWLDPDNARLWLTAIAETLSRIDPENAATYAANAEAAAAEIAAQDARLRDILAPVANTPFVTFHDAYGYFAAHYGLAYRGALAAGDATVSGAARLAELEEQIAAGGVVCVFPEAQHDPDLIAQLADSGIARLGAALDPSGSTLDAGPDNYAALMEGLAVSLTDCLGR
jgi:zinc transport system substrate-binding protein